MVGVGWTSKASRRVRQCRFSLSLYSAQIILKTLIIRCGRALFTGGNSVWRNPASQHSKPPPANNFQARAAGCERAHTQRERKKTRSKTPAAALSSDTFAGAFTSATPTRTTSSRELIANPLNVPWKSVFIYEAAVPMRQVHYRRTHHCADARCARQ